MAPREFKRSERVAGELRRELAQLIQRELKDPAVGFVSVSGRSGVICPMPRCSLRYLMKPLPRTACVP